MTDESNWLVPITKRKLTPNRYRKEDKTNKVLAEKPHLIEEISGLVIHYTASGNTLRTVDWLCNPTAKASAHFVVGKDGDTWQLASLADRTWHAGGATSSFLGQRNVNGRTIGIEIVNWGVLAWDASVNGWLTWPEVEAKKAAEKAKRAYTPKPYTDTVFPDPTHSDRKAWEPYPDVQVVAVCELIEKLAARFPTIASDPDKHITGHEDVDPMRKSDPGRAWPWKQARDAARIKTASNDGGTWGGCA